MSDPWVFVKLDRYENGESPTGTSIALPVQIPFGRGSLTEIYNQIWVHFTTLMANPAAGDRANVPLEAELRPGDGIEKLTIDWNGNDWHEQAVITQKNLAHIVSQCVLSMLSYLFLFFY